MSIKLTKDDEWLKPNPVLTEEMNHVPDQVLPPYKAYRFFPPQEEKILTIGNYVQRLIFEGGEEFNDEEWEYINAFEDYLEENKIEVSAGLRLILDQPR